MALKKLSKRNYDGDICCDTCCDPPSLLFSVKDCKTSRNGLKYRKRYVSLKNSFPEKRFDEIIVQKNNPKKQNACLKGLSKFLVSDIAVKISLAVTESCISTPCLEEDFSKANIDKTLNFWNRSKRFRVVGSGFVPHSLHETEFILGFLTQRAIPKNNVICRPKTVYIQGKKYFLHSFKSIVHRRDFSENIYSRFISFKTDIICPLNIVFSPRDRLFVSPQTCIRYWDYQKEFYQSVVILCDKEINRKYYYDKETFKRFLSRQVR